MRWIAGLLLFAACSTEPPPPAEIWGIYDVHRELTGGPPRGPVLDWPRDYQLAITAIRSWAIASW